MTILRTTDSLRGYYAEAVAARRHDGERLYERPRVAFRRLLASIGENTLRSAVDLGYGCGKYTRMLARSGFHVTAVDMIPASILLRRLRRADAARIDVVECDLRDYQPVEPYGVVVAKDVLHFLDRATNERLLGAFVAKAPPHSYHYLEVFTDIRRRSSDGSPVRFQNEAQYTRAELAARLDAHYRGWDLTVRWLRHRQFATAPTGSPEPYFEANRAIVIATNRGDRRGAQRRVWPERGDSVF